jgi:hypothetical protein
MMLIFWAPMAPAKKPTGTFEILELPSTNTGSMPFFTLIVFPNESFKLDSSVNSGVRGKGIVQQDSAGIAGMNEEFVGVGLSFNQATALDQQQAVLVFYFEAFIRFHFARELGVKRDAALIEVYFNNPILKEIQAKLPVCIVTGIFIFPDVNVVAL